MNPRMEEASPRTLAFPRRINVEPTNECNMRCRLCPHPIMRRPKGRMDLSLFGRIVEECARRGASIWLQYMGEPLLHPQIVDMIRMAKAAGVEKVGLSTNAYYLTEGLARRILESGLDRLECSVDALDEKEFEESRGSPHYRRVIANIQGFLRRKREMGSPGTIVSIQYMAFSLGRGEQAGEVIERWQDWLSGDDFIMSIQEYSFAGSVREAQGEGRRTPCRWTFEASVILWDGTVALCGSDFDGRAAMGSLTRNSLAEIWKGPAFEAVREVHRKRAWANHPLCRNCDDWRLSDGSGYVNLLEGGQGTSRPSAGPGAGI